MFLSIFCGSTYRAISTTDHEESDLQRGELYNLTKFDD